MKLTNQHAKTAQSLESKDGDQLNKQNPKRKIVILKSSYQTNCGCNSHQSHPYIGTYHQAPEWMRYEELTIGYRINFSSIKLIFKSLFMIHNETTNVWTHLIGVCILLVIAMLTCSDFINIFYQQAHVHIPSHPKIYSMGSGRSFFENATQICFDEQFLVQNNQNSSYTLSSNDQLAYDICENRTNRHECYIKKSHERKFRNWIQFTLGMPLNKFQEMKLKMETKIVPEFVHEVEGQIHNKRHDFKEYFNHYLYHNESKQIVNYKESQIQNTLEEIINHPQQLAKWPLVFFLVCNSICLLCSVTYHLFYPLSQSMFPSQTIEAHSLCVCTDFAGISVLFGGSAIPCIYYGMYCYFEVGEMYLTGIITASFLVFVLSFTNKFQDRKSSTFRVLVYTVFACFMITPCFHLTINELIFDNYNDSYSFVSSLEWYVLGLMFYAIGAIFYASQLPNRFSRTGKYDLFGHSHHYWHVCVLLAILMIYAGCLENYFTRRQAVCLM